MSRKGGNGRPLTVLCIDDGHESRALLQRLFESEGCRVLTCPSGVRGLEMAETAAPDLIVLDLALPFMDGFETANRLKTVLGELGREVPVVAVSIHTSPEDRDLALAAGCDGFIAKPVDVDRFAGTVFGYVRGRRDRLDAAREKEALLRFHRRLLAKLESRSQSVLLDESTGLYNERYLYKRLDEELSRSLRLREPFSLALIELRTGNVTDEGPSEAHVRQTAEVLRNNKRAYDVALRLEGNLFGVILGSCPEAHAAMVGGRLCEKLRSALAGGEGPGPTFRLWLGTNTYDSGYLDPESFVKRARRSLAPYAPTTR